MSIRRVCNTYYCDHLGCQNIGDDDVSTLISNDTFIDDDFSDYDDFRNEEIMRNLYWTSDSESDDEYDYELVPPRVLPPFPTSPPEIQAMLPMPPRKIRRRMPQQLVPLALPQFPVASSGINMVLPQRRRLVRKRRRNNI